MTRWLQAAKQAHTPNYKTYRTDETQPSVADSTAGEQPEGVLSGFVGSVDRSRVEIAPRAEPARIVTLPSPSASRGSDDIFRHGASVTGLPRTWTGRIVSLDEWRRLSEWDRHGPAGRMFCGACQVWVMPGECPHCEGGAA